MDYAIVYMITIFKKHGAIIISLVTGVSILASALIFKGTEYENMWLFILVVGSLATAAFEFFSKKNA